MVERERKTATRRWYKARHGELREIIWVWDPLGLKGAPDDEYDGLIDRLLGALARGAEHPDDLKALLRRELLRMADVGYSGAAAERESEDDAAEPMVQRIAVWWRSVPPPP